MAEDSRLVLFGRRWTAVAAAAVVALVAAGTAAVMVPGRSAAVTARWSSSETPPTARGGASTTASSAGSGPFYLALGDSVPVWNGSDSYPYQIASHFAAAIPNLTVVDMACSGETTSTMLSGSQCAPGPSHSQMQEATTFLESHQGSVAFITIDIGGNDVVNCASGTTIDVSCVLQGLTTMQENLDTILSGLRQAAGPTVPIVAMNYFDPFLGDWLAGGSGQSFAIGSVAELNLFNEVLDAVYGTHDVPVADVASAFRISDLTDTVTSPWGTVPVAVDNACTLLDITCDVGQLEGFGDDPVVAGADRIAQTFEPVIAASLAPTATTTTEVASTTSTTLSYSIGAPAGSPSSSSTSPGPTAASGTLAFTGLGPDLAVVAVSAIALIVSGLALVTLGTARRRLIDARPGHRRPPAGHQGGGPGR